MQSPVPPAISEASATIPMLLGGLALILLLIYSLFAKASGFSLRWLCAVTIAGGLFFGGVARMYQAHRLWERYRHEMQLFQQQTGR